MHILLVLLLLLLLLLLLDVNSSPASFAVRMRPVVRFWVAIYLVTCT